MCRFLFRLDANTDIGFGHLSRCSVLASVLVERGHSLTFASRDRLDETHWFCTDWGFAPMETEDDVGSIAEAVQPDVIVADLPFYPPSLPARLRCGRPLALFDDYQTEPLPADLLINTQMNWRDTASDVCRKVVGGPRFALVRSGIGAASTQEQAGDVLITMGGSDTNNVTAQVIEALAALDDPLEMTVVLGPGFTHHEALRPVLDASPHCVRTLRSVTEMLPLFGAHTLTVTAVGVTLYELAHSGTPAIAVVECDYQAGLAGAFAGAGTLQSLSLEKALSGELCAWVRRLLTDPVERNRMTRAGRLLLDGLGPQRLADELEYLAATS